MKQKTIKRVIVLSLTTILTIILMSYTYVSIDAKEAPLQAGTKINKPPKVKGVKYNKSTDKIIWNKIKKPNKNYIIRYHVQFRADYSYGKNKWDKWRTVKSFEDSGKYLKNNWSYLVDTHHAPTQYRVRVVYKYKGNSKVGKWNELVKIIE